MGKTLLGERIARGSFFDHLLNRAREYARNPEKLSDLATKARKKADATATSGPLGEVRDVLTDYFRLLRAYAKGDYRQIPWQSLVLIVAGVLYFLSPLDVVPDFIVGLGFVDDVAVLAWVMRAVFRDLQAFRQWEASHPQP